MLAISGFLLKKESTDTWDKQVGSTKILPRALINYNEEAKYPNLSAGAATTKHSS